MTAGPREVRAPRGTTLTAKSWQTEAPMRMLMNNPVSYTHLTLPTTPYV